MKKEIMKRAWELAKEGVKKFGGKVREYLASSLSIAWKESKKMAEQVFNASEIVLASKRGNTLIIAVPTAFDVEIADGLRNVAKPLQTATNNGVEYSLYGIFMENDRYAPFIAFGDGFLRTLKADVKNKTVYLNSEKKTEGK